MTPFRALAVLLAAIAVGAAAAEHPRAETAARGGRLVAFGSCGALLDYVRPQALRFVGPYGFGGAPPSVSVPAPATSAIQPSFGVQGEDFSGTNVQEEGVDEPDLVKTDGSTLFTVLDGRLRTVDVREKRPRLLDTLELEGADHELLLHGGRLLVLSRRGSFVPPRTGLMASFVPPAPEKSLLTEIDVSEPGSLRFVRSLALDAAYLSARLVGSSVRIVASAHVPSELPFERPDVTSAEALAAARERNRAVVMSSTIARWLPSYRLRRAGRTVAKRPLVQCRNVRRAAAFSGLGLLTVLTVDLGRGLEPVHSSAVVTDGRIVYASRESLYVATEPWANRPAPASPGSEAEGVSTAIHRFDISSPVRTQYRGSGRVSGILLSEWSLSEHRGVLRVVSTDTPGWQAAPGRERESHVTTLGLEDGGLVQAGRIGDLGKGESVYAVRFAGDVGYVVTFRLVDPLYTLDLSDPARPRVLGELKIPGYSAYLHPVGDGLLLGVGVAANEEGQRLGAQVSLFDVSDLTRPKRLHHASLGLGWSEVEADHHAFLFWPRTGLVVVPFEGDSAGFALGFTVGRARGIDRLGLIEHEGATERSAVRRSLVVRDAVLTVSAAGVQANRLATLEPTGWAGFPAP